MFGIIFCVLLAFNFLNNLVEAAALPTGGSGLDDKTERAGGVALQRMLPTLDDKTMQATFGTSIYHSQAMKESIGLFHANGDQWTDAQLKDFF